jgi:pimeloyl-ACP methyl ester carboxylesterase
MKFNEYSLVSFDNTVLNVYTYGDGKEVMIISNGLGGNIKIFKDIIKELPNFKFISWDYRGLYKSHAPENKNDVTILHHVKDLEEILKKEKVKKAHFLGWSVGATINLQLYKKSPSYFKTMVLLNPVTKATLKGMPPFIRIFNAVKENNKVINKLPILKSDLLKEIEIGYLENIISPENYIYKVLNIVQKYHKVYSKFIKLASSIPRVSVYLKTLRFLNRHVDDYFFEEIFKEYAELDMDIYIEILKDVIKDTNNDEILPKIKIPVLLIASTRDIFVPHHVVENMKNIIPNVEYLEVFRGSHYSLIEFPEMISLGIKRFLRRL